MKLFLVSASKNPLVDMPLLQRIAEALEFQQFAHVAPFCQTQGIHVGVLDNIESLPEDGAPLPIYDSADQAGDLGWHTYNAATGQVHGAVFLDPILQNGGTLLTGANSLSAVCSHECCEAGADPYVNLFAWVDATTIEPYEACDRVQGDSYEIGGVACQNFLGPRAFRDGIGPYDRLRKLQNPWDLSPGGYCERTNVATGKTETLWGRTVPKWKKDLVELKRAMGISRLAHRQTFPSPRAASGE